MTNNETLIRQFIQQVWNDKISGSIAQFVSPAYTIHLDNGDPWEGQTVDHHTFAQRLRYSFDSFSDMHFDIRSAIADGDMVALTWLMTGTNNGPIGGFPPTHRSIAANGVTLYHISDGKVTGHTQVYDRTTIMKQLGFIPA